MIQVSYGSDHNRWIIPAGLDGGPAWNARTLAAVNAAKERVGRAGNPSRITWLGRTGPTRTRVVRLGVERVRPPEGVELYGVVELIFFNAEYS